MFISSIALTKYSHSIYRRLYTLGFAAVFVVLLWAGVGVHTAAAQEAWSATDWSSYDTITIDSTQIDDDLTDFPVYVDLADLSASFWATTPSGSTTVGTDIRVTTGTSSPYELPRELVSASSSAETGELHFKADSISSTTDTVFRIWYNGTTTGDYATDATFGAENVWTNDYVGVWHLEADASEAGPQFVDSTSNRYAGTANGAMTSDDSVSGQLAGNALEFDGSNDFISMSTSSVVTGNNTRTLSAWYRTTATGVISSFGGGGSQTGEDFAIWLRGPGADFRIQHWAVDFDVAITEPHDNNVWHQVQLTYNGSQDEFFFNGTSRGTKSVSLNTEPAEARIGLWLSNYYSGEIDEVRLASTTRSAAWISAEYTNQSTTTDFYSVDSSAVVISGTLYENDGTTPYGGTATVTAAVGTSTPSLHRATTDGSGSYSITGIPRPGLGTFATSSGLSGWQPSVLTYGNGRFVGGKAFFGDALIYSDDGVTWSAGSGWSGGTGPNIRGVTYGDSVFVAVVRSYGFGGPERVLTSPDGITWTPRTAAGDDEEWMGVAYGDGTFVATADCSGGGDCFMYSTDQGVTWSTSTSPFAASGDNDWFDITYGEGRFVAVEGNRNIAYSDDGGQTWASTTFSGTGFADEIVYGDGTYVVASSHTANEIFTSPDGVSWTARQAPLTTTDASSKPLTYANGTFVGVRDCSATDVDSCIMYSTDRGATWATTTVGATSTLQAVAYGQGKFVALNDANADGFSYTYTADAGFGENTPITLFVDGVATTSSTTASTLTYGINNNAGTSTISGIDLAIDTVRLQHSSTSGTINLADADVYDAADDPLVLFTATTSTTTIDADLTIAPNTTVLAPQHLVLDGDFTQSGTFRAERGEVHLDAQGFDIPDGSARGIRYLGDGPGISDPKGMHLSPDGSRLFIARGDKTVGQYNFGTAYDATTLSFGTSTSISSFINGNLFGITFNTDGSSMYVMSDTSSLLQFDLSTAWDITTRSFAASSSLTQSVTPHELVISPDGGTVLVQDKGENDIDSYTLTTPGDVSAVTYDDSFSSGDNASLFVDPAGRYLVIPQYTTGQFKRYTFSTPWDISTLGSADRTTSNFMQEGNGVVVATLDADGRFVYAVSFLRDILEQYEIDTPQTATGTLTGADAFFELTQSGDLATTYGVRASTTHYTLADGAEADITEPFSIDGNYENNGRLTRRTSELTLTGGASTTNTYGGSATSTLGSLRFTGGTYEAATTTATTTDLTIESGAIFEAPTNQLVVDGDYTLNGTLDGIPTITLASTSATYGGSSTSTLGHLIVSGSYTAADTNATTSDLTIKSGGSFAAPAGTLNLLGNFTQQGSFDANSGTVRLGGDGSPNLEALELVGTTTLIAGLSATEFTTFSATGEYLYFQAGASTRRIDLATPWDITTASSTSDTFAITGGEDIAITESGTRFYVLDGGVVTEYTLATPWTLGSATAVGSTTVSDVVTGSVFGLYLRENGVDLYVNGDQGTFDSDTLAHYQLTTPYDITSASLVATTSSSIGDRIRFSADGRFVLDGNDIEERTAIAPLTTPWDITTRGAREEIITHTPFLGVTGRSAIALGNQDRYLYVGGDNGTLAQFDIGAEHAGDFTGSNSFASLTVADDVNRFLSPASTTDLTIDSSATLDARTVDLSVAGSLTQSGQLSHRAPTSTLFLTGSTESVSGTLTGESSLGNTTISGSYTLSNAARLSDLTIAPGASLTTSQALEVHGDYTNGGTFTGAGSSVTYNSPSYDLAGVSNYTVATSVSAYTSDPHSVRLAADGTRMYVLDVTNNEVEEFALGTAWDIASASFTHATSVGSSTDSAGLSDIALSPDGSRLFVAGTQEIEIWSYTLSTPWDVSTAALSATSTMGTAYDTYAIDFSPDGTTLIASNVHRRGGVTRFTLNTPWDITDKTETQYWKERGLGLPSGLRFANDGATLYQGTGESSGTGAVIARYELTTPYDLETAARRIEYPSLPTGGSQYIYTNYSFSPDGRYLYRPNAFADQIEQYTLRQTQTATGTQTGTSAYDTLTQDSTVALTFGSSASSTGTFTIASTSAVATGATSTVFNAGSSYSFENIDWQGASTTQALVLRSSASGTQWQLDVPGSQLNVQYVDVADSDASPNSDGPIIARNSTSSGNNLNWSFSQAPWNATDWTSYDTITIKHENIDESLSDFPVYVDLSDLSAAFWSTTPSEPLVVGTDIRVTTDDGTPVELPRELVAASSSAQTGELHFKADFLNKDADTSFRIYYNGTTTGDYATDATYGAENVWTNDYLAVYHFAETANTDASGYADATANDYDGTGVLVTETGSSTKITGPALRLGGSERVELNDGISLSGLDAITMSAWVNYDGSGFNEHTILSNWGGTGQQLITRVEPADDSVEIFVKTSGTANVNLTDVPVTPNQWSYVTARLDATGDGLDGHVDGVESANDTSAGTLSAATPDQFWVGATPHNGVDNFVGLIDELRIASTNRSNAWVAAEYMNQSTTTDFYALGAGTSGTGSTTLLDHDATQVDNAFDFQNETDEPLFAFKLTPQSGTSTITELTLELRGAKDITVSDFSNITLYRDNDNDAQYDATDIAIGTGVMSLGNRGRSQNSNQIGTIVFSDDFVSTTTQNYLVVADWNYPENGSQLTIDLHPEDIEAIDTDGAHVFTGSVDHIQHNRNISGGGGGSSAAVGGPAPAGDGDVSGGGSGGGDAIDTNTGGGLIGNTPDFFWPTAGSGDWQSIANAYDQVDGTYATTSAASSSDLSAFSDSVPGGDTIEGIAVKLEGAHVTAGEIAVELSFDGGSTYTSSGKTTSSLSGTDQVVTLGGPSDTWGRSWTPSEFSNANFRVRITGDSLGGGEVRLDALQVRVYHQAGGGSSGGGGAI